MKLKLQSIIVSTRPGRVGPTVAHWFHGVAQAHGKFDAALVDLADFDLPVYDEPHHPKAQRYTQEHTRRWSASVAAADAYVFVLPEYNYFPPPSFVNALDYVYVEWNYKPCGFVSYGGISGGLRSTQMAKQLAITLKLVPMVEGVTIPMVAQSLDADRKYQPNEHVEPAGKVMLDELAKWALALRAMRDTAGTA